MSASINIKNKKAEYLFEIFEEYSAGIQLTGTEIKSIRLGKASIAEAFCYFKNSELWVKGMHIAEYKYGTYNNHEPKRERKLLLTRQELKKLERKTKEKGFTITAIRLFMNENGYAKLDIALGRGKGKRDKREDLKRKDAKRDMDRGRIY